MKMNRKNKQIATIALIGAAGIASIAVVSKQRKAIVAGMVTGIITTGIAVIITKKIVKEAEKKEQEEINAIKEDLAYIKELIDLGESKDEEDNGVTVEEFNTYTKGIKEVMMTFSQNTQLIERRGKENTKSINSLGLSVDSLLGEIAESKSLKETSVKEEVETFLAENRAEIIESLGVKAKDVIGLIDPSRFTDDVMTQMIKDVTTSIIEQSVKQQIKETGVVKDIDRLVAKLEGGSDDEDDESESESNQEESNENTKHKHEQLNEEDINLLTGEINREKKDKTKSKNKKEKTEKKSK